MMLKKSSTDVIETASKRAIQKIARATGDLTGKLEDSRELHHRIIQKQLQMKQNILGAIKKYPKKGIYLQKKDRRFLMI